MSFLDRIDENLIKNKPDLVGLDEVLCRCKKTIDLTHGKIQDMSDLCVELDIRSVNIFYGKTGTGKTTLSYCLAKYALQKYRIAAIPAQIPPKALCSSETLSLTTRPRRDVRSPVRRTKGEIRYFWVEG